jgi:tetratricopeptide (TPR) repeat protein
LRGEHCRAAKLVVSSQPTNSEAAPDATVPTGGGPLTALFARFIRFLGALRNWTTGHWLRSVIVAGTMLTLIALTMAGWAYLATVAIHAGVATLDSALAALDEGRYAEAREVVDKMLKSGSLPKSEYGGPLFVLGAIKVKDAAEQQRVDRRRVEYLVASRYLQEARAYGFPAGRAAAGTFLLGNSLIECGQFEDGLQTLEELLAGGLPEGDANAFASHRMIADTCLTLPQPQLERALSHNMVLATDPNLSGDERARVLLQRAECYNRLERFDDAKKTLASIAAEGQLAAELEIMRGKIDLDEIESTYQRIAPSDRAKLLKDAAPKIAEATSHIQQAQKLEPASSVIARQAGYLLGRGLQRQGDAEGALAQFSRTRQLYGESYEGLAASLAEADLLREQGDLGTSLLAYRRVLESIKDIPVFRSNVLPVAEIRERLIEALKDLVNRRQFEDALKLVDEIQPPFSPAEQLELRGNTFEEWGNLLISESDGRTIQDTETRKRGLHQLRASGAAFEQLAKLRFGTKFYTADLWKSAENFFNGHSFTRTIELLDEYLRYEPELRNAEAMLRLGQAHLALRQIPQSIAAFEECIEFHPLDGSTFQARIDCAKAYWQLGNISRAEQLLRDNIAGSTLKPSSREWKDSLFELGMLLHESGRHEEAIGTLEEAIDRYPNDRNRLVAQYEIGESYRRWAGELTSRSQDARTESERKKRHDMASDHLNKALKHFEEVQVAITFKTHDIHSDPLLGTMLRNCYMLEGTVLFDLEKYKEAIEAYSNVASLYPDDPFVLETFVQISNCWRRLDKDDNARGAIKQAQIALDGLPTNADFTSTTALSRDEWRLLLADLGKW